MFITARKQSLGQGNIFQAFAILSTGRGSTSRVGSVSGQVCIQMGLHPRGCTSKASAPGGWTDHPPQHILWDMVNEWVVRILLECILV